jgi:YQGE family putative transporter
MFTISGIFRNERLHFIERIAANARRVIYSDIVHTVASPLTDIFLGAFIWRNTGSLLSVLFYKIGEWIFLPITFYLNGRLLKKLTVQKTFALGSVLAGLSPLVLIFLGTSNNFFIILYGCLYGIGGGYYWANRNYLEFKETIAQARKYFFSMLSAVSGFSGIVVPLLAGWFIIFGATSKLYTPTHAYWGIFMIAFFLLITCAVIIWHGKFESITIDSLKVKTLIFWSKRRILSVTQGLIDGVGFIANILLLYFLGNEGALGTTLSITAVCVIIATYIYGRFVKDHYERPTLLISALLFLVCAVALAVLPPLSGIFIYVISISIAYNFFFIASAPIGLALADEEANTFSNSRYAFIIDNELFLNTGRMIGAAIIMSLIVFGSQNIGLFYGPALIAIVHIIFISIFFSTKTA